eukprot:383439_1
MSLSYLWLFLSTQFILRHTISATCNGTAESASCYFPYKIGNVEFGKCTHWGRRYKWCATTADYDNDNLWGYCSCNDITPSPTPAPSPTNSEYKDHYAHTKATLRGNGYLKALITRITWSGLSINTDTWEDALQKTNDWYSSVSWDALNYNFTIYPSTMTTTNIDQYTCTVNDAMIEAFRKAEKNGYIWCGGVCGYKNYLSIVDGHYDVLINTMSADLDTVNPNFQGWVGLAGDNTKLSLKDNFTPSGLTHEMGHNLGLGHMYCNKYERIDANLYPEMANIGWKKDAEDRMGGGKWFSQYFINAHYSLCAKEYFGWLNEDNFITISANGINSGVYTINAFDRYDVSPNNNQNLNKRSGSKLFGLKIVWQPENEVWESQFENIVYIYYRTAYLPLTTEDKQGVTVQFCRRRKDNGASTEISIKTWTFDVQGDTITQRDHYIPVGSTFALSPFMRSLENEDESRPNKNTLFGKQNIPQIKVLKQTDWSECDIETLICPNKHNISVKVEIDFIDPFNTIKYIDKTFELTSNINSISDTWTGFDFDDFYLIHVKTDNNAMGSNGRGDVMINFCPMNYHLNVYFFDKYPYHLMNGDEINPGIGCLMTESFSGNIESVLCIQCKVKAIQIVQNDNKRLHIAEMKAYDMNNNNIINTAKCYSFPLDVTNNENNNFTKTQVDFD